jgi:hypothetical protein
MAGIGHGRYRASSRVERSAGMSGTNTGDRARPHARSAAPGDTDIVSYLKANAPRAACRGSPREAQSDAYDPAAFRRTIILDGRTVKASNPMNLMKFLPARRPVLGRQVAVFGRSAVARQQR